MRARLAATLLAMLPGQLSAQSLNPALPEPVAVEEAAPDLFARDTFQIQKVVCPFRGDIDYEPGDIECGFLRVPENREKPDSRFIDLHFVKINSTWDDEDKADDEDDEDGPAPGKRDDPVIYLTGGPGAQVVNYVKRLKDHTILEHRDLYILEQRGIGYSADFCPHYSKRNPEFFDVETFEEQLDARIRASDACTQTAVAAGVDLTGYNTIENARDVAALRQALGFEQWNVWGISYGSVLGQAYIKVDPDGIRAIALDAIVPLFARDDTEYWRVAKWYDRDLKKLDELCQADSGCKNRFPKLGERVRESARMLAENPLVVEVEDVERYPSKKARFYGDIAAFLPFFFFYEQDNYPGLPALIYAWADAVERRDATLFKAFAAASSDLFESSAGMSDSLMCNDGYMGALRASGRADLREFPVLASAIGTPESLDEAAKRCHEAGIPPQSSEPYGPVETDLPALIIEGDMDPITPPPLAKAILPGFKNGTYVEFPFAGHGPSRSVECAGDLLNLFFDNPTREANLSCVDKMEKPDFFSLYRTSVGPRMIVMAIEDEKALAAPAAWGGISILSVLIAFVVMTFAPVFRRIDEREAVATLGARWVVWGAAFSGVLAVALIGAAIGYTYDSNEALLLFGLVSWAGFGAFFGLVAGLAGAIAIGLTWRARRVQRLPIGTLVGFLYTGLAAMSLSAFLMAWDLGVF